MEALIHLDTHLVAWLFAGDRRRLRPFAAAIEKRTLVYSPMVELELQHLFEIERTTEPADAVLGALTNSLGLLQSTADFGRVIETARAYSWTRDPFDRVIVATAAVDGAALLTADRSILDHCKFARRRRPPSASLMAPTGGGCCVATRSPRRGRGGGRAWRAARRGAG
ncbi:MAG: PIN domain-containing protein [Myxococcales bacterium]|nr:PIN domain-containing protein [Myxococcales bacterium]